MKHNGHKKHPVLGIDIGRVIIGAVGDDGTADTTFLNGGDDAAMVTPATQGAFETIAELVQQFEGRVWLVSKCGPKVQARSRRWLAHNRFFQLTGVEPRALRFCRERHQKADHCRKIKATHFIDDRLDVLRHLRPLGVKLYWFGKGQKGPPPPWVTPVVDWAAVRRELIEPTSERRAG